jgi:hypothetical protein
MLFSLIFCLLLIITFYYKKYVILFCLSIIILIYSIFLYNCFYDNVIISEWLEQQNIEKIELLTFQKPEFEYNAIFNTTIAIIGLVTMIVIFIFKIFLCF